MRLLILAALVLTMALATAGGLLVTSTSSMSHEGPPPREDHRPPVVQTTATVIPVSTPTPTPTTTAKYTVVTKVATKKKVRYLETSVKYGAAGRFTVKQKVCKGKSCRTVTHSIPVTTGAGSKSTKLGTGSYRLSGKPKITVKVLPWPTRTVTATPKVTATATVTTGPTVTQSVAGPTVTQSVAGPTVTESVAGPTTTITVEATVTITATVTEPPTDGAGATVTVTAPPPPNAGCDAPWNPYRYHYCTTGPTALVTTLPPDLCTYFECLSSPPAAPTASGERLVVCDDGKVVFSTPNPSPDPCGTASFKAEVHIAPDPDTAGAQSLVSAETPTPALTEPPSAP